MPFDNKDYSNHPAAKLTAEERKDAIHELSAMDGWWTVNGQNGWYQGGAGAAPGRSRGYVNYCMNDCVKRHCLVSHYYRGDLRSSPPCNPIAFRAMGFADRMSGIYWNNDSETTFEMVLERVRGALEACRYFEAVEAA